MYKILVLSMAFFQPIFAGSCSINTPLVCEWKAGAFGPEKELLKQLEQKEKLEDFEEIISKIQDSEFFLLSAYKDTTCVGFLVVSYDKRKKQMCIDMLIVKPSCFGKKVAKELIVKAQERFDADSIVVACKKDDSFLRELYTDWEFSITRAVPGGKSPLYYTGLYRQRMHTAKQD